MHYNDFLIMQQFQSVHSNCRHEDSYGNAVTRKHLCAGFHEGGPDACQNDSGGPLVCERGGRWTLFGVINHGIGCGQEKKYGLYARVVRYNRSDCSPIQQASSLIQQASSPIQQANRPTVRYNRPV